jgi:superfamily II DNA or RNA helicase
MVIKIGITKCQLIGEIGPALRHKLRTSLSYKDLGRLAQRGSYMKRYGKRMGGWDGTTYLISDKLYIFDSGFLPKVKEILTSMEVEWTEAVTFEIPSAYDIPLPKVTLWDHQRNAITAIKIKRSGIIQIGTGGGKTITSIVATAELGQLPVLFVVNRIKLLKQAHFHYEKLLGEKVGFIGNGEMTFGRFNIATVHTLCSILDIEHKQDDDDEPETVSYSEDQIRMLNKLLFATRCVVVDECHHASSSMYIKLLRSVPNAVYRIGLSATPFRTDGTDILLEAAFGPVIYKMSSSELIRREKLARPIITFLSYSDPERASLYHLDAKGKKAAYQTVFQKCIIENDILTDKIAKVAIANARMNRLTLVSVTRILHGDAIMAAIKRLDPNSKVEFLNGENKQKLGEDRVIQDFTDRKILILISTLMDEGVDIPSIEVAINAGGGASPSKALQLAGRAMRLFPGKECCHIYDFIHPYTYLYNHAKARLNIFQTEEEFIIKTLEI